MGSYCVVRMSRMLDSTLFKGWIFLTEWSKGHKFHMPDRDDVRRCEQRVRAYYLPVKSKAICHMTFGFARQLGISGMGKPENIQLGNQDRYGTGTTVSDIDVTVRLANCNTRWHCHVFDLILGQA